MASLLAKIGCELNLQRANASFPASDPPWLKRANGRTEFVSRCINYSNIARVREKTGRQRQAEVDQLATQIYGPTFQRDSYFPHESRLECEG